MFKFGKLHSLSGFFWWTQKLQVTDLGPIKRQALLTKNNKICCKFKNWVSKLFTYVPSSLLSQ